MYPTKTDPATTEKRKNRVVKQPASKCILNSRVQDSHFVSRFSSSAFREGSTTRFLRQERASRLNGSSIQDRTLDFQRWTRSSWSTPRLRTARTLSCRNQRAARLGTASTRFSDWRTTRGVIRKWRITLATRRKTQVTFAATLSERPARFTYKGTTLSCLIALATNFREFHDVNVGTSLRV